MSKQNILSTIETLEGMQEELGRLVGNLKSVEYTDKTSNTGLISSYPHLASPKVLNSLNEEGFITVRSLSNATASELMELPGIGVESIRKLRVLLECYGLRLDQ